MKLRLFAIRDTVTGKTIPDLFFTGKPDAKRQRDKLDDDTGHKGRHVVTPGPDHRRANPQKAH